MRKINKIKLFINNNERSKKVAENLELELKRYNFEIIEKGKFDLGISIGGDGSFLRMIKSTKFNEKINYIGINSGTLGFLQEIDIDKCIHFVKNLNNNNYQTEEISIGKLLLETENNKKNIEFLNEIVIREKDLNVLKTPIYIDDELLEHYNGDGILISTSTGSTAYNISFGGPIVYNTLNTLIITPIAPINNASYHNLLNSIIIPNDKTINIKPNNNIIISTDGENKIIKNCLNIEIKISSKKIKCLRMSDFHFIKTVNKKILKE